MRLELLLAHDGTGQPVLGEGLAVEMLRGAAPPASGEAPARLWDATRDADALHRQRWGLVVPEGERGDRLLSLVAPLRQRRQEQQGGVPVKEYRVPARAEGPYAARWKKHVFRHEATAEADLPRYLLVLGDLDEVPLEVQQVLATDAFVGRLAFRDDAGYAAYVAKVLRWEEAAVRRARARLLFYTSRDGTAATEKGHAGLMLPSVAACQQRQQEGTFPEAEVVDLSGPGGVSGEQLLACAVESGPSVLFSLGHGRGPPAGGWASARERLLHQGDVKLPDGRFLSGQDVAARPFLPGGMWFSFACFSVGTPAGSSYAHWLRQLPESDPNAARGRALLPAQGERPFIAALPQAALANPEGPLAVVGHVDLAWSFSFHEGGRRTPSRFLGLLKALAEGHRVGVALSTLLQSLNETSSELATLYDQEERERLEGRPSTVDPVARAQLWLLRQDLANYLLLGDPAVRLPLAAGEEEAREGSPPDTRERVTRLLGLGFGGPSVREPSREPAELERAILALLTGQDSAEAIAGRHGVSPEELRQWEALYRAAGREALARHLASKP